MKTVSSLLLLVLISCYAIAQEKVSTRFFNPDPVSYLSTRNFQFVPDTVRLQNEVNQRNSSKTIKPEVIDEELPVSPSSILGGVPDLPYPILFVHGLTGNLQTWSTMTNFLSPALGPSLNLNFCLNSDANNGYAFHGTDITSFIPNNLQSANVYKANFYCSVAGNCANATTTSAMYSHQAGIFKQGKAVGLAIQAIINATGKDKVVLVGHSMGGLAIREYMQNQLHWFGTEHHIAKLVTVGTPHAGSDFELAGFAVLGELFQDVDTDSEAVRDLRSQTDGIFEWNPGVFLWGGLEDQDYMYDDIFPWYNVDVNCDGTEGDWVTGLNERNMWNNFEFASIADNYDLVVAPANVGYTWTGENFGGEDLCLCLGLGWTGEYSCESWDFDAEGGSSLGHSELPNYTVDNLWAFDEADDYEFSYEIDFETVYAGFVTPQASNGNYASDYDDYRIYVPSSGELIVGAEFLGTYNGDDMYLYEVSSQTYIAGIQDVGPTETMSAQVNEGWYIVEFNGVESTSFSQYFFGVTLNNQTGLQEMQVDEIQIYPVPSNGFFHVDGIVVGGDIECSVINSMGQMVQSFTLEPGEPKIDISNFPSGYYTVRLVGDSYSWNGKVLKSN